MSFALALEFAQLARSRDELSGAKPCGTDVKPVTANTIARFGKFVPRADTVRSFKEIIEGKHDDIPESAFMYAGSIEEVLERAKKSKG